MRFNFDPRKFFFREQFNFCRRPNKNPFPTLSDFFQEAFLPPDIYCHIKWQQEGLLSGKTKQVFLRECTKECTVFQTYALGPAEND